MSLKRSLAAFAAVAAVGTAVPATSASAANPIGPPVVAPVAETPGFFLSPMTTLPGYLSANPSCPAWYNGPTNPMTGCPYWLMS
jgi:hypothetical protein